MRRFCTVAATIALLTGFWEAPFFHFHGDSASDHARKHHQGQGRTFHTHWSVPSQRSVPWPAVQSPTGNGDNDAIFLAQTADRTQGLSLLPCLPLEATRLALPDCSPPVVSLASRHSHDPPFVPASFPRPPPA